MTTAEFTDEPHLTGLLLKETWRRTRRRVRGLLRRPGFLFAAPDRLPVAFAELRRGDPRMAEQISTGSFPLAGHLVEAGEQSPFALRLADPAWSAELHGFGWLRHMAAANDALSDATVRALLYDWTRLPRRQMPRTAFEPDVAARRIVSWLTHAPVLLREADAPLRRRFFKALMCEARRLRAVAGDAVDGLPRLQTRLALVFAALSLPLGTGSLRAALRHLGDELDRQIFADGGHASRNPAAIASLLADLLPLRQAFAAVGQPLPRAVFSAIDRMLPALRFFRHGEGTLALFNGAAGADPTLVAALLAHDETLGEPIGQLRQSGYGRLSGGGTTVIADIGLGPAPHFAGAAGAGTLAFEFSSARRRIVVNCGAPARADADWRRASRATAAHSTLVVADESSSRFACGERLERFLGAPLVAGPTRVPVQREDDEAGQRLTAAHDGYRIGFGLVHERSLRLSRDGRTVEGCDRLFEAGGRAGHGRAPETPPVSIRFHLHPDVQAERAGRGIRLFARGDIWWFFADAPSAVEESIFFADRAGPRRTNQIVVDFDLVRRSEIGWRFERHG